MQPGTLLANRYRIEGLLGRGGMGAVYAAITLHNGMRVAIKVLRPDLHSERLFVERLRREALAMRLFDHPHVVRVLDLVVDDDRPFLAMELLEGKSLGRLITRRGIVDAVHVARVALHLLRALDVVHRAGFVHRDVKPDNIYLARSFGEPLAKLLDFGLVKRVTGHDSDDHLTAAGGVLGTWQYMAREQALGQRVDGRTDLYALGASLYYALTKKRLHETVGADMSLFACSRQAALPLRRLRPDLSEAFCQVIDRAVEKMAEQRWESAAKMAAALREAVPALYAPESSPELPVESVFSEDSEHAASCETSGFSYRRDMTTEMHERDGGESDDSHDAPLSARA